MTKIRLEQPPLVLPEKGRGRHIFVLGADDPEMRRMQQLLDEEGQDYLFATHDGKRCNPYNSYLADPVHVPHHATVVLIECEPKEFLGYQGIVRIIDHHRVGDPGYDVPSHSFWIGSSLGQLYRTLGKVDPTKDDLLLAAMDHCMVSARNGECPGIDPEELRAFSLKVTCEWHGLALSEMEDCIQKMSKELAVAPRILIGGHSVVDFTGSPTGIGYSLPYLCTREALANLHLAALVANKNHAQAPLKVILCGKVSSGSFDEFMNPWGPDHGLEGMIIARHRGYALGFRR